MPSTFAVEQNDARDGLNALIAQDARVLSGHLASTRQRLFPPAAQKTLRQFSSGEAAALIGISDAYLRELSLAGEAPEPVKNSGGPATLPS
jgi:chromosome partitioning protein